MYINCKLNRKWLRYEQSQFFHAVEVNYYNLRISYDDHSEKLEFNDKNPFLLPPLLQRWLALRTSVAQHMRDFSWCRKRGVKLKYPLFKHLQIGIRLGIAYGCRILYASLFKVSKHHHRRSLLFFRSIFIFRMSSDNRDFSYEPMLEWDIFIFHVHKLHQLSAWYTLCFCIWSIPAISRSIHLKNPMKLKTSSTNEIRSDTSFLFVLTSQTNDVHRRQGLVWYHRQLRSSFPHTMYT